MQARNIVVEKIPIVEATRVWVSPHNRFAFRIYEDRSTYKPTRIGGEPLESFVDSPVSQSLRCAGDALQEFPIAPQRLGHWGINEGLEWLSADSGWLDSGTV